MPTNFTFYQLEKFKSDKLYSNCTLISLTEKKKSQNRDDLTKFALYKEKGKIYLIFFYKNLIDITHNLNKTYIDIDKKTEYLMAIYYLYQDVTENSYKSKSISYIKQLLQKDHQGKSEFDALNYENKETLITIDVSDKKCLKIQFNSTQIFERKLNDADTCDSYLIKGVITPTTTSESSDLIKSDITLNYYCIPKAKSEKYETEDILETHPSSQSDTDRFTMKDSEYQVNQNDDYDYNLLTAPSDNIFIRETDISCACIFATSQYEPTGPDLTPSDVIKIKFRFWSRENDPLVFDVTKLKTSNFVSTTDVKEKRNKVNERSFDMFGYYGHLPFMNLDIEIQQKQKNGYASWKGTTKGNLLEKTGLFKFDDKDFLSYVPFRLKIENNSVIGIYNFYHKLIENTDVRTFLKNHLLRVENEGEAESVWKNETGVNFPYIKPPPQQGGSTKYIKPQPAKTYEIKSFNINSLESNSIVTPIQPPGFPLVPAITFETLYSEVKKLADLDKYFLNLDDITADKINALGINESKKLCNEADNDGKYAKVKNLKLQIQTKKNQEEEGKGEGEGEGEKEEEKEEKEEKTLNEDLINAEKKRDEYITGKVHGNERVVFDGDVPGSCNIDIETIDIIKNKESLPFIPTSNHPFLSYFINLEYTNAELGTKHSALLIDAREIVNFHTYHNDETSNAKRVYNKYMEDKTELWKDHTLAPAGKNNSSKSGKKRKTLAGTNTAPVLHTLAPAGKNNSSKSGKMRKTLAGTNTAPVKKAAPAKKAAPKAKKAAPKKAAPKKVTKPKAKPHDARGLSSRREDDSDNDREKQADTPEPYEFHRNTEFDCTRFRSLKHIEAGATLLLESGENVSFDDNIAVEKIVEVRRNGKSYKLLTPFQLDIMHIFTSTPPKITDKRIEITAFNNNSKLTLISIPNKFKKLSMKDFLTLITLKDVRNKTSAVTDQPGHKLVKLIKETYQQMTTDIRKFIGTERIKNLKDRSAVAGRTQIKIMNEYIKKKKPQIVIFYTGGKTPPLPPPQDYTPRPKSSGFTVWHLTTVENDILKSIKPEVPPLKNKPLHNRMIIPTESTYQIPANLFVKDNTDEDINVKFNFANFKFIDCTTSKIIPKQKLTTKHSIYHPNWGLFNNKWTAVSPYNVTVALKRLFTHIKLNQIIYIFDYDDDKDAKTYIKVEQARLINMIDKWNYITDKNDKSKNKDIIKNVVIHSVELITNRDDASLTVMYILKYRHKAPEEESSQLFYKRLSGHNENGEIAHENLNILTNEFKKHTTDTTTTISAAIGNIAKEIRIEYFIENLETINKYPEMVERFIRHEGVGQTSGRTMIDSIKASISSGSSGIKKAGYQYINGKRQNTFHIPFHIREKKFKNLTTNQRKKIIQNLQKGGAGEHTGNGILSKTRDRDNMLARYYGCIEPGICTDFGDLNIIYGTIAKKIFYKQSGGKSKLDDFFGLETSELPTHELGTIPTDFKAKSTLQHETYIKNNDYNLPKPNRNPITIPNAYDPRINQQYLYKWAHPLNFGESERLRQSYDIISAIGNSILQPNASKSHGQSIAKYGVKNSRKILNENGITLAKKNGVNEHNIPFFLSNPNKFDSKSLMNWEAFDNIQDDPYDKNPIYSYFGNDAISKKKEVLLRQHNEVRHRRNAAELNFGGPINKNIFEPTEPIVNADSEIDNDRLIEEIINVVLPNTQTPYLQPDGTEAENAVNARYYGEKSFI
jgi:hypothetical protein